MLLETAHGNVDARLPAVCTRPHTNPFGGDEVKRPMVGQAHQTSSFVPDCYHPNRRTFRSGPVSSRDLTVGTGKPSALDPDSYHGEVAPQTSKYTPGLLDLSSTC